ncbi:hypothetical protein BC629DRAFT_1289724 [Irpex lacteus]|nr:hypothetical protein BC629DRAFT_1289724 [Irpex lacteus]
MSTSIAQPSAVHSPSDLPPTRDRKGLRPVSPPLSNISMHRFNYYLALAGALLLAFYAWRLVGAKAQAGGWWNLALGKQPSALSDSSSSSGYVGYGEGGKGRENLSVEERINELAHALGMPSTDLANAIADAVREYVPPASIKSIAAHQTG